MKQNDKQIPVILIVDDVEVNARLLKKMVEKMGYQGLTATGVKEAVSQMQERTSAADLAGYYDAGYERLPVLRIIKRKSGYKGYSCHLCIGSQRA